MVVLGFARRSVSLSLEPEDDNDRFAALAGKIEAAALDVGVSSRRFAAAPVVVSVPLPVAAVVFDVGCCFPFVSRATGAGLFEALEVGWALNWLLLLLLFAVP